MAARRKYNVKGTKDFVVLAGIFFFLCLWAIKDAWYPSEKVLKDHPRRVEVAFPVDGTIKEFNVVIGGSIMSPKDGHEPSLLGSLNDVSVREEFNAKKEAYIKLQDGSPEKAAMLEEINTLKTELGQYQLYCPELGKEKGGTVSELLVRRYDKVNAGQPVLVIKPNKGFYIFNKSLAIISFIAFWVFLGIHVLTR